MMISRQTGHVHSSFDDSDEQSLGDSAASSISHLVTAGCAAAEGSRWAEAASFFVSATAADPKNAAAFDMLSQVLLEAAADADLSAASACTHASHAPGGSHTPSFQFRAVRAAEAAVSLRPLEFSHRQTLGRAQLAFGEPSMALASFKEAQRLASSVDASVTSAIASDIADAERAIEWLHTHLHRSRTADAVSMPLDGAEDGAVAAVEVVGGAGRAPAPASGVPSDVVPSGRIPLHLIRAAGAAERAPAVAAAGEPATAAPR